MALYSSDKMLGSAFWLFYNVNINKLYYVACEDELVVVKQLTY